MNGNRLSKTGRRRTLRKRLPVWPAATILLVALSGGGHSWAQADNYLLRSQCFGVEDGLSSRSVYDFLLDRQDVLWIATKAGLDSYDGTKFTRHAVDQGGVNMLFEGASGGIWTVGYTNAVIRGKPTALPARIHRLDSESGELRSLAELGAPPALLDGVTQMSAQPDRPAYFAARDGSIWRYRSTFARMTAPVAEPIEWMAHTADGIAYYQRGQLQLLEYATGQVRYLRTVDRSHALGVGRLGPEHLYITELDAPYTTRSGYRTTVCDLTGRSVFGYQKKIAWAPLWLPGDKTGFYHATAGELLYSSWTDSTTQTLSVNSARPEQAGEIFQRMRYADRHGRIYASVNNGFCGSRLQVSPFQTYLSDTLPSRSIRLIAPQDTARAYVSTSYGLFYLAPDTVMQLSKGEFPTAYVRDHRGDHWLGYHGPIVRKLGGTVPPRRAGVQYLHETDIGLIAALAAETPQTLRLGTDRGSFELRTADLSMRPDTLTEADGTPIGSSAAVYQYFTSPLTGTEWIVSDRGIFERVAPTRWRHLPHLGRYWYNHVHQDAAGIYWMGTRTRGLLRYDPRTETLTAYGTAEGLADPCIYAVYEDERERLWLPSNKGLMQVDKSLREIRVYLPEQGLPHEEFNWGAHARDEKGYLYFGGLNGFVRFHPDTVRSWEHEGQRELPPRWKNVQRIERKDGHAVSLLAAVRAGRRVRYQPEESFVQLAITRPNFTRKDIRYRYRVVGQTAWKPLVNNEPIELGYFPYGNQELEVVRQGNVDEVLLRLPFCLIRPIYARWWFVPALVAGALLFGYLIFYIRLQRLEQRRRALRAEVDRQTEDLRKLNQFKDRFFSVLSHDLRSPLLGLRGLSKKARFLVERGRYEELTGLGAEVDKSTEAVQRLIGNVFEWAQIQQGEYELQLACINPYRLLEELAHIYQPLADANGVSLKFEVLDEAEPVADLHALRTIFRNLIDNAVKNCPARGHVRVRLGGMPGGWYLTVHNDGAGMPTAAQNVLCTDDPSDLPTRTLGLRLVRELTLLQGGRVRVTTESGTQVRIAFAADLVV